MASLSARSVLASILTKIVRVGGVEFANQPALNFIGAGVSAVDNPATGATDVTISGAGGGGARATATTQGEVDAWGGSVPVGACWGRTAAGTAGYLLPTHGSLAGGALHALAGTSGAGFTPTTASQVRGMSLVLDSALNPSWAHDRLPVPEDFATGTTAARDLAGDWETAIGLMFAAAAATDGVVSFTQGKIYGVSGQVDLPDDITIVGNNAKLFSAAARTTWNMLSAVSVSNVDIFNFSLDGGLQGNGNAGALGHCLYINGSTDLNWDGGSVTDVGVATVTGAACGIRAEGVPKRCNFKNLTFSQAATSFGNGAFAVSFFTAPGVEDITFLNCDFPELNGFKAGINLDGSGGKRYKITGGRYMNSRVHGILVGYTTGNVEWDVQIDGAYFWNCAGTGMTNTGPNGTTSWGVKLRNCDFEYCGGGGSSIMEGSIQTSHGSLELVNVNFRKSGFDAATGLVRTYAKDAVQRAATAFGAFDLKMINVTFDCPTGGGGALSVFNIDRAILHDITIDAPYGIGLTVGAYGSGVDTAGARRFLDFKNVNVKTSHANWHGISVEGHHGASPVELDWDGVRCEGPGTGTALASDAHSGVILRRCKGVIRNSKASKYDRDAHSSGVYMDDTTCEYLAGGQLRLINNDIGNNHHGVWLPAIGAGLPWLLLEEQNYHNNTSDVTAAGAGAATRFKRASSIIGRKVIYSTVEPTAAGHLPTARAGDELIHPTSGLQQRCTATGDPGTWPGTFS